MSNTPQNSRGMYSLLFCYSNVVVLNEPLDFTHWGQTWQANDHVIEMRAEVGLLTRNVKVIGDTSGDSGSRGWYAIIFL